MLDRGGEVMMLHRDEQEVRGRAGLTRRDTGDVEPPAVHRQSLAPEALPPLAARDDGEIRGVELVEPRRVGAAHRAGATDHHALEVAHQRTRSAATWVEWGSEGMQDSTAGLATPAPGRPGGGLCRVESSRGRSPLQELERVRPRVPQEPGDAPEDAERLDRARGLRRAHVLRLPAERVEHLGHHTLRLFVVSADEHGRLAARQLGVDHQRVPDAGERLHEPRRRRLRLEPLHERLVRVR